MLSLNRRHSRACKHKNHFATTELYRCQCPLMVMGMDGRGVYHNREALHTKDPFTAQEVIRQIESGKIVRPLQAAEELTISEAWKRYKEILVTQRRLKPSTIAAIEIIERSMLAYAAKVEKKYFREVDSDFLEKWIGGWEVADSTMLSRRCYLDRLFDVAVKRKWIADDPTQVLMRPKAGAVGITEPYDLEIELPRIMDCLPHWEDGIKNRMRRGVASTWANHPRTAEALIRLLRLTGLRISDAFVFNPRSLVKQTIMGEEMYCYFVKQQKKTDHPVFLPFYSDEVKPILEAEWLTDQYAFWDGKTDMREWTTRFTWNCLRMVERVSGVADIHAHRFRDTFAVELLSKEMDIRTVSRLLGHKAIATTLKYYEHYIKADQDRTIEKFMQAKRGKGNVVPFPVGKQA